MINCSTYFFEATRRGYSQYPQDYAEAIFRSYRDLFTSDAQLVAHRRPTLKYYTYMKRLPGDAGESFFGITVVINGLETTSIKSLFKLFERTFHQIVSEGEILTINTEGAIASKDIVFGDFAGTFRRLANSIKIITGQNMVNCLLVYSSNNFSHKIRIFTSCLVSAQGA